MNIYLDPPGFLGTGASLLADLTLCAYILLIVPAMLIGFAFARRGKHRPHHQRMMTLVTIVNWLLIAFLMLAAYRFDVAPNFGAQPNNTRYLLPVAHALFGIPAQLLATFVVIRMFREDTQVAQARRRGETNTSRFWFRRAKPVMRLTLALWLVTALLGIVSYLTRYNVFPAYALSARVVAPQVTEDVLPPVATLEIQAPVATEELDSTTPTRRASSTPRPTPTASRTPGAPVETEELEAETEDRQSTATRMPRRPAATAELAPVETPEVGG